MEILKLIWGWNWEPIGVLFTLIVGIFGVQFTLRGQGRQARCQQERQWAEDRSALRKGLIVELQSLCATLAEAIQSLDKSVEANEKGGESQDVLGIKLFEAPIYLASLAHLGRLTDPEVDVVVAAYQALSIQDKKIRSMLSEQILGKAHRIRGKNLALCRDMLRLVLPEIEKALEELRKNQTASKATGIIPAPAPHCV